MLITREIGGAAVRSALATGRIVAHPAESMYGLGVVATDAAAVERLRALKGSPGERGFIVLAANPDEAGRLVRWTPAGREVARRWPAPLTIVLPALDADLPVASDEGTVAVRVPADGLLRALLAAAGAPIVSTSANRAGGAPARTADEVVATFGEAVDVVVDGGPRHGPPSTVVDATGEEPHLVRAGAYPWPERTAVPA